ncbi:MAG: methyltransferase domain-containing protein [Candidatus Levybacteria bacterium]|nr:methyltransferase domain-containing protein [Candidatus Levybacteria bacterium]
MNKSTSWGKVARWYNELLKNGNSYQQTLILPNLIRLLQIKKGELVLDLACGQGFFAREFAKLGAKVIGVDISSELIDIAKNNKNYIIEYHVSPADKLTFLQNESIDKTIIVLALQNIQNVNDVVKEANRVLKQNGKLFIVINHPCFRIPKESSWGWDDKLKIQYRRLDSYLSESKEIIQMHPGNKPWEKTISFHRPLQFYFKALSKNNLLVSRLEEWNSNRISELGPKKEAEDAARKEFPLFLFLEAFKQ